MAYVLMTVLQMLFPFLISSSSITQPSTKMALVSTIFSLSRSQISSVLLNSMATFVLNILNFWVASIQPNNPSPTPWNTPFFAFATLRFPPILFSLSFVTSSFSTWPQNVGIFQGLASPSFLPSLIWMYQPPWLLKPLCWWDAYSYLQAGTFFWVPDS